MNNLPLLIPSHPLPSKQEITFSPCRLSGSDFGPGVVLFRVVFMRATMLCPQCRSEYRAGFHVCSDCQIALIPKLPQQYEPIKIVPYVVVGVGVVAALVVNLMHWPALTRVFYGVVLGLVLVSLVLRFVFKIKI